MFSQTELENYKLQVELLQEKLKRSEDQRQQLEERYETMTKKRIEQEKGMKNEFRRKYQCLLEEQKQRNERNKCLIKLLDKVDQQAAVLAARTERLRMLKIQYELYLTRMLQFQCIKSIENNIYYQPVHVATKQQFSNLRASGYSEIYAPTDNSFKLPATEDTWTPLPASDITSNKNLPSYPSASACYRHPGSSHMQPEQLLPAYDLQRNLNFKTPYGTATSLVSNIPMKSLSDQRNKIDLSRFETCPSAVKSPNKDDKSQITESSRLAADAVHQIKNHEIYGDRPSVSRVNSVDEKGLESDRLRCLLSDNQMFQRSGSRDTDEYDIDDDDSIDNDEKQQQTQLTSGNIISDHANSELKGQQIKVPPNERKISLSELPLETVLKDISKLSFDRLKRQTKFNFGEENPSLKESAHTGIQFKKKEKLSIENIENAIYGERIDPLTRKMNEQLLQPEIIEKYDQQRPINEYVEKEKPHDVASNEGQPNEVLVSTKEPANEVLESETYEQLNQSGLPIESTETVTKIEVAKFENGDDSSLQNISSGITTNQSKDNKESHLSSEFVENKILNKDIYKDDQQSATLKNDNAEAYFAENPPDINEQTEQNLCNTNIMEYDDTNYGYSDQPGYYQEQGYEQSQEYGQQGYDVLPQEYDYSQQPNFNSDEYNQPYQEDMTYNYAAETYPQTVSVDVEPSGDIINQIIPNLTEDSNQLENDSDFLGDESRKFEETASGIEATQKLTQEQKTNNVDELTDNTVAESYKIDEITATPQTSAGHAISNIVPTSILSSVDKQMEVTNGGKKKKRVNFVDSETDDNSSQKAAPLAVTSNDESDFDFSSN